MKNDIKHLKEATKHIKNSHVVPQWFHDNLNLDQNVEKITSYKCDKCDHQSLHYSNFMKHYRNLHGKAAPSRLTNKECPQCGLNIKDLPSHIVNVHK